MKNQIPKPGVTTITNYMKITNRKKAKVAASIIIHKADTMTPKGRKDIAKWMMKTATFLIQHGPNLANNFRARYIYQP